MIGMTDDERRSGLIFTLQCAVKKASEKIPYTGIVNMTCEFITDILIPILQGPECKDAAKALSCYEWISVEEALPKDGEKSVLAVKQLKDGRRDICIARCIPDYEQYDPDTKQHVRSPYWVCGGNNNIIYWMPLPEIPEE